jgi:hypothetical protein
MNYRKLDTALAMALNEIQNQNEISLVVFVHTENLLDSNAIAMLENLGICGVGEGKQIHTASLSINAVSQLSEQNWVKYLKLSQKLGFVNQG